ncbi:hypothetical protein Pla52o_53280 [Novipirellula galeiformis]|uniref:Uncharacterized protein n=1 Tax=Novipirellula galeiformis TaxID=2528004 RepID=A0A5C6BZP1_9BACT|nr:hypothetical protein [Novipirellula galeiformis]TWU17322.1 hypothetical protein Pla52o_53280 [Novipirellula galeiformis]
MKAATVSELKKALAVLDHQELLDACVRLAKFKVDNKELLTYLLMKSGDERGYANEVCAEIDEQFPTATFIHKKTMRKIIRSMDKRIRYSGDKETELQIRIHFCRRFIDREVRIGNCRVSANMYAAQLKKIEKAIEKVHPDLQFDFRHEMEGLESLR